MVCVAPFPGLYYEWWPLWCCSEAGGSERGEGRGLSVPSRPPNPLLTACGLLAGRHEKRRESERDWRKEKREGGRGERARVCACCVCAWIAPPHPVHRFCRRPSSDGENKTDRPSLFLRFMHRRVIPDVTDRLFYVARIESCADHLGETVTPWLWLWNR